jgi:hypothetical protein
VLAQGGRGRHEVALQRIAARPGNQDDFTDRIPVPKILAGAFAHTLDGDLVIIVGLIVRECRCLIVVHSAQPVTPCRQYIAFAESGIAPLVICISDPFPFPVPGIVIRKIDAAGRDPAFGKARAAFLSCGKKPHEFGRQVFPVGRKDPFLKVGLEPHTVDIQNIFLSGDFIKYPDGLGKRSLRIAASHSSRQATHLPWSPPFALPISLRCKDIGKSLAIHGQVKLLRRGVPEDAMRESRSIPHITPPACTANTNC